MKYTLVNHEARELFDLNMFEYALADSIYHLSNGPKSDGWATAKRYYYAKFLMVSERHITRMIKKLEEKGLIISGPGTKLKTTAKWYSNVVLDNKKMDKTASLDNLAMENTPQKGATQGGNPEVDNSSSFDNSGSRNLTKRPGETSQKGKFGVAKMSSPSNKDSFIKGFNNYKRELGASAREDSPSLENRIASLCIEIIQKKKLEEFLSWDQERASGLIGQIVEWLEHLEEKKGTLTDKQVKANVESILLHRNPESFVRYNVIGGYNNLYEPSSGKNGSGNGRGKKKEQTFTIQQANNLFLANSLGGTNGSGYDFDEVFERISGEGKDVRLRLREGKRKLIKDWSY